jgi:hypothetical protein
VPLYVPTIGWDCFGRQFGRPSRDIFIRNVTAVLTADDDAAGVAIGSEMSGGVYNVTIEDCLFGEQLFASGVYIKSSPTRGGRVQNVTARRIILGNLSTSNTSARDGPMDGVAVFVSTHYGDSNPSCPHPPTVVQPVISGLIYEEFAQLPATFVRTVAALQGDAAAWVNDVTIRDVNLPNNWNGFECAFVRGNATGTVPTPCAALRANVLV